MNGRYAKKIRKAVKREDVAVAMEFKKFVNGLPFMDRLRLALKAVFGRV